MIEDNPLDESAPTLSVGWLIIIALVPIGLLVGLMLGLGYINSRDWENFKKTCREKGGVPTAHELCLKKDQAIDIYP